MNRSRPFTSPGRLFAPAIQYLSNVTSPHDRARSSTPSHEREQSLDDDETHARVDALSSLSVNTQGERLRSVSPRPHRRNSSGELTLTPTRSIPLIDLSRSPSPYPRSRSAAQSEDEDEDGDIPLSLRPLIAGDADDAFSDRRGVKPRRGWKSIWREGGLGRFLLGTWIGYQIWVLLLVLWVGGCGFGFLLTNRFIFWTGVYKFPYPLTATWMQLVGTHILLFGWSSLTRGLARPLQKLGLKGLVAPSTPGSMSSSGYRTGKPGLWTILVNLLKPGTGGIAGGGALEFDRRNAWQALPPAVIFMGMTLLGNLSFACVSSPQLLGNVLTMG